MSTTRRDAGSGGGGGAGETPRTAGGTLLGKDDPPPVEVVNPDGAAPFVFLCDHASNRVPRALDNLGLPPAELDRHIAWDIGAAAITRRLAAHFDAPAVLAGYSRLVIDCNRRLEDEQSILGSSDGTAVPGNRDLAERDAAARVEACFRPYHRACAAALDRVEARGGVPPVVMMHSFTPAMNGTRRPWHAGVLWDGEDGRMALPLLRALRARNGLHVGDNEPYSGTSHHGYTMPAHAARHGRANVQIEVRQDLVADEPGHRPLVRHPHRGAHRGPRRPRALRTAHRLKRPADRLPAATRWRASGTLGRPHRPRGRDAGLKDMRHVDAPIPPAMDRSVEQSRPRRGLALRSHALGLDPARPPGPCQLRSRPRR